MAEKLSFFVAGLGRFGKSVALTLDKMGYDVMGMDIDEDVVQSVSDQLGYVVCADAADEKNLRLIGADNCDVAIVAISNLSASLMATLILRELGIKRIVVRAISEIHGKLVQKIGADKIIYSEREMGVRVAHNLTSPGLLDYIELDNNITVISIHVPKDWVGKGLKDLDVRQKYNINVAAIKRGENMMVNPRPDLLLSGDDTLIILGDNESVKKITDSLG